MSNYLSLVAGSGQINTPPGSYNTIKEWIVNSFLGPHSRVLEVGCSTGFIAIEIARYVQATCCGLDLHKQSIETAKKNADPWVADRVSFIKGDAGQLPFTENKFSHVVIGGHLPFVPAEVRQNHIKEAVRVTEPWGYVLTALYFYHMPPPAELIKRFNAGVGTKLQPEYDRNYWSSLFEHPELELEHESTYALSLPDETRIQRYVRQLHPDARPQWEQRLRLFSENGQYLRFFVRVYRKYPIETTLRQTPRGGIYTDVRLIERREL